MKNNLLLVLVLLLLPCAAQAAKFTIIWSFISKYTAYKVETLVDINEEGYVVTHNFPDNFSLSLLFNGQEESIVTAPSLNYPAIHVKKGSILGNSPYDEYHLNGKATNDIFYKLFSHELFIKKDLDMKYHSGLALFPIALPPGRTTSLGNCYALHMQSENLPGCLSNTEDSTGNDQLLSLCEGEKNIYIDSATENGIYTLLISHQLLHGFDSDVAPNLITHLADLENHNSTLFSLFPDIVNPVYYAQIPAGLVQYINSRRINRQHMGGGFVAAIISSLLFMLPH